MSFTSPVFLFAFLPLTVIVYQLARSTKLKNAVWIAAGLSFRISSGLHPACCFMRSATCGICRCCSARACCTMARGGI